MAKKFKQFIYPDSGYAETLWIDGSMFTSSGPIVQLGVQAIKITDSSNPTTQLLINSNSAFSENNEEIIKLGYTGIFELDLTGISQINKLRVNPNSDTKVIVDIVYEDGSDK